VEAFDWHFKNKQFARSRPSTRRRGSSNPQRRRHPGIWPRHRRSLSRHPPRPREHRARIPRRDFFTLRVRARNRHDGVSERDASPISPVWERHSSIAPASAYPISPSGPRRCRINTPSIWPTAPPSLPVFAATFNPGSISVWGLSRLPNNPDIRSRICVGVHDSVGQIDRTGYVNNVENTAVLTNATASFNSGNGDPTIGRTSGIHVPTASAYTSNSKIDTHVEENAVSKPFRRLVTATTLPAAQ